MPKKAQQTPAKASARRSPARKLRKPARPARKPAKTPETGRKRASKTPVEAPGASALTATVAALPEAPAAPVEVVPAAPEPQDSELYQQLVKLLSRPAKLLSKRAQVARNYGAPDEVVAAISAEDEVTARHITAYPLVYEYLQLAKQLVHTAEVDSKVLTVCRDLNNVLYLQVTRGFGTAEFIVNKSSRVERITLDAAAIRNLDLQVVEGASIAELTRLLLRPRSEYVTISIRAKFALLQILNLEGIETMASEKKFATITAPRGTTATKAAPEKKAAKPVKAEKKAAEKKVVHATLVTLKRMPKEGKEADKLPPQAVVILETLQKKGGKLETTKLFTALQGKLDTQQPINRIYAFYRKRLLDGGFITVSAA